MIVGRGDSFLLVIRIDMNDSNHYNDEEKGCESLCWLLKMKRRSISEN